MGMLTRRIHVPALALAGGITWGFAAAVLAVWVMITDHGTAVLDFIADLYPWYDATVAGCLWGALWGFIDMFGGLFLFGLLYNLFAGKPKNT
ncbi:MAG TPA: hypothetical protein VMZ92_06980 [Planctomycetota bacterium]|nr:hypothetical protein [Planctomycetota bacterium]